MKAESVTPILNVSDFAESVAWFERIGWTKAWEWGDPPGFGSMSSGKVQIFLCHDGQGGRGKGTNTATFTEDDNDKGCWMSIWVSDVDAVHQHCIANEIEVTLPPTNFPWNTRELHIRHPDGHVFRISQGNEED
jgi:hypothetical protein